MEERNEQEMEASNNLVSEAIARAADTMNNVAPVVPGSPRAQAVCAGLAGAQSVLQKNKGKISQFQLEAHLESIQQLISVAKLYLAQPVQERITLVETPLPGFQPAILGSPAGQQPPASPVQMPVLDRQPGLAQQRAQSAVIQPPARLQRPGGIVEPPPRPRPQAVEQFQLPEGMRITQEQCRVAYLALAKVPLSSVDRPLANLIIQLRTSLGAIIAQIENRQRFGEGEDANNNDDDEETEEEEVYDDEDEDEDEEEDVVYDEHGNPRNPNA